TRFSRDWSSDVCSSDLVFGQHTVLHRIIHDHAVTDQLHQVLVGRHDHDLATGIAYLAGIGGDQVVGLETGQFDTGHAKGLGGLEIGRASCRARERSVAA